jgi:hypothetical protein
MKNTSHPSLSFILGVMQCESNTSFAALVKSMQNPSEPRRNPDPPDIPGQTRRDSKMNATTGSVGVPSDVDLAHGNRGVLR